MIFSLQSALQVYCEKVQISECVFGVLLISSVFFTMQRDRDTYKHHDEGYDKDFVACYVLFLLVVAATSAKEMSLHIQIHFFVSKWLQCDCLKRIQSAFASNSPRQS